MTAEELLKMLTEHVLENDTEGVLDPNGHYSFSIVGFMRPKNPDEFTECNSPADRKATVGSVSFTLGAGAEQMPPIEEVCARSLSMFNDARLADLIAQAQAAIRKREGTLQ